MAEPVITRRLRAFTAPCEVRYFRFPRPGLSLTADLQSTMPSKPRLRPQSPRSDLACSPTRRSAEQKFCGSADPSSLVSSMGCRPLLSGCTGRPSVPSAMRNRSSAAVCSGFSVTLADCSCPLCLARKYCVLAVDSMISPGLCAASASTRSYGASRFISADRFHRFAFCRTCHERCHQLARESKQNGPAKVLRDFRYFYSTSSDNLTFEVKLSGLTQHYNAR